MQPVRGSLAPTMDLDMKNPRLLPILFGNLLDVLFQAGAQVTPHAPEGHGSPAQAAVCFRAVCGHVSLLAPFGTMVSRDSSYHSSVRIQVVALRNPLWQALLQKCCPRRTRSELVHFHFACNRYPSTGLSSQLSLSKSNLTFILKFRTNIKRMPKS